MQADKPTATATVLHHHPLLLLLLLWSLAGLLTPSLAQDHCNAADDIVLAEGKEHNFPNKEFNKDKPEMTLFMKRNGSSAGFTVNVTGTDGNEHTAWFPAKEEWFPVNNTWYQLLIFVNIKTEDSAIEFGFQAGQYEWTCERHNDPQDLQSMSVVARGAARWRTSLPPKDCYETPATQPKHRKLPACKEPEPSSTGALRAGTTTVVLSVAAVVVAAVMF